MSLSAIEVELLRNALASICDEMYVALMKSAYSTNIKERKDHSSAIFDTRGRVVVQGESLPLHLASMLGLVEVVLERVGRDAMRPGDMFISNDPFVGRGSHLPDVALVAPIFHDGAPGRLRLQHRPPRRHRRHGTRLDGRRHDRGLPGGAPHPAHPHHARGRARRRRARPDSPQRAGARRAPRRLHGQVAANLLGERRLAELLARWPLAAFAEGADAIIAAVTRRMRNGIAGLPDGEFRFADVMDDDGMGTTDIPIMVRVVVDEDKILFDFAGSAPQVKGNMNVSFAGLQASVLFALKVLIDPEGPTNHGMLDPVRIEAPLGSIVNATFPAATAARAQTCQRIIDAILGALADAVPERVIAASNGANGVATFSGVGPDGRFYVYLETIGGGAGARSYKDGGDGVQVHVTNTSNLPIESLEKEYPLLIERYELVPDSGGAGTWRGGLGLHRVYRGLDHAAQFSGQGERCVHHPWGLFGGGPGGLGGFAILHDDGRRQDLPIKPMTVEVPRDAVLSITTPGAGGYGAPEGRDAALTAEDAESGKFSAAYMKRHYGFRAPRKRTAKGAAKGKR